MMIVGSTPLQHQLAALHLLLRPKEGELTEQGSKSTTMTKMTTCSPLLIIGRPPATLSPKSFPTPLDYNDEIVIVILLPSLCPTLLSLWLKDENDEEATSPLLSPPSR